MIRTIVKRAVPPARRVASRTSNQRMKPRVTIWSGAPISQPLSRIRSAFMKKNTSRPKVVKANRASYQGTLSMADFPLAGKIRNTIGTSSPKSAKSWLTASVMTTMVIAITIAIQPKERLRWRANSGFTTAPVSCFCVSIRKSVLLVYLKIGFMPAASSAAARVFIQSSEKASPSRFLSAMVAHASAKTC